MIRCFPHNISIRAVKYTSNPLRTQLLPGHRNTFLAVCCDIVLAPYLCFAACLLRFAACCMASKSKPWCRRKRWSCYLFHTTYHHQWSNIYWHETINNYNENCAAKKQRQSPSQNLINQFQFSFHIIIFLFNIVQSYVFFFTSCSCTIFFCIFARYKKLFT